jgi:endonuclease YncB( thermonuclease family)
MRYAVAFALSLVAFPAAAAPVSGSATVIDGDTLEIDGRRIRLFGIDAPELSQTCDRGGETWACGSAAADELRSMIGSYPLSCEGSEVDIYGRLLAVCYIGGVDLNRTLVAEGWATAFRRYSDNYVADETRARGSKRGLWSSSFTPPETYRQLEDQEARSGPPAQSRSSVRQAPTTCAIKGNRNKRGEWIYHLPGRPYYNETRAEEMFCTEAEAQAAGYRRSKA